jgi:hypothetical protein
MIAANGRLDQAHGVVGRALETVLREAEPDFARVNLSELRRDATFGGPKVPLNGGSNQRAQLVFVHSTHSR